MSDGHHIPMGARYIKKQAAHEARLSESHQRERVLREALVNLISAVNHTEYGSALSGARKALAATTHPCAGQDLPQGGPNNHRR